MAVAARPGAEDLGLGGSGRHAGLQDPARWTYVAGGRHVGRRRGADRAGAGEDQVVGAARAGAGVARAEVSGRGGRTLDGELAGVAGIGVSGDVRVGPGGSQARHRAR